MVWLQLIKAALDGVFQRLNKKEKIRFAQLLSDMAEKMLAEINSKFDGLEKEHMRIPLQFIQAVQDACGDVLRGQDDDAQPEVR